MQTIKEKNYEPLKILVDTYNLELTELHERNISVSEKNGFYIYNYNNSVLVPRDDQIIKMCRGIVLNSKGVIVNLPFTRFFNYHEKECDEVDLEVSEVFEKLDGSLISVWWTGEEWEVTTRGAFYPHEDSHNFKETFKRLFKEFNKLNNKYNYMFELISKDNRIVTKYDSERVVLIGAREINTLNELNQKKLDKVAENISVDRPKRFNAISIDECRQLFGNMNDDEEGLVVVDKDFNRFKLKQESYLKMAKIISLKNQDVLDYMLGRVELDTDFTDMPELIEKVEEVKKIYNDVKKYAMEIYNNIKYINNQKEFASHALNYNISGILFGLKKGKDFDDIEIRWQRLEEYHNTMVVPTPNKIVVLQGIPSSGKSTWVKENGLDIYVLSMDTLRLMYSAPNPFISQENNAKVYRLFIDMLEERMKHGSFTILDATHTTEKSLADVRKLCKRMGYEMEVITFNVTLEEALMRNKLREEYKQVPEDVINKMYKQIQTFINGENK